MPNKQSIKARTSVSWRVLTAAVCLVGTVGCSSLGIKFPQTSGSTSQLDEATNLESLKTLDLDAFAARGFLGGSDFERYRLVNGQIWRECGMVLPRSKSGKLQKRKSLEGDEIFPNDPNLTVAERRVDSVNSKQAQAIESAVREWMPLVSGSRGKTPLPGSVFSLAEPGVLELGVKRDGEKARLVTSVDAVSDKADGLMVLSKSHALLELLRGVGPEICQRRSFFGIGRETL